MAQKGIKQGFIITTEKVKKDYRPVIGKTSNVSDQIVDECQNHEDIYMVQKMFGNSHTTKRAVKKGASFNLISDDGETVIEKPKMHSVCLIL